MSPVDISLFTKLLIVCWEPFYLEIYIKIFADTSSQIIVHVGVIEVQGVTI
jgi:hypothetical protein